MEKKTRGRRANETVGSFMSATLSVWMKNDNKNDSAEQQIPCRDTRSSGSKHLTRETVGIKLTSRNGLPKTAKPFPKNYETISPKLRNRFPRTANRSVTQQRRPRPPQTPGSHPQVLTLQTEISVGESESSVPAPAPLTNQKQEPFHVHSNHHIPRHRPAHSEPDHNPTHQHSDHPTRTLRRPEASHHDGRRSLGLHVAGRSKDPRPGATHDSRPSVPC